MRKFLSMRFRLQKYKKFLFSIYALYLKRKKKLLPAQATEIEYQLKELEQAILVRDVKRAKELANCCRSYTRTVLKKSSIDQIRDFFLAIGFALIFALMIRQAWFELYEIPTGSMRPTFKEQDRLIVSKTSFGIDIPFMPQHFYFDPDLVKRSGIVVFTVENMDVRDADTLYFYFFPGKKQFVKRLIGKPGDTLYFYGGKIYGIDCNGRDISSELQLPELDSIDHIPFIRFEGNVKVSEPYRSNQGEIYRNAILHQMNEPVALLSVLSDHRLEGEILNLTQICHPNFSVKQYGDLWGMKNYAMTRLLTPDQMKGVCKKMEWTGEEGTLFLELRHGPSLHAITLGKDQWGRLRPRLELNRSYIPLKKQQLEKLFQHLYTARFVVKNGFAMRYTAGEAPINVHFLPKLKGIPDGTYEFYNGIGYRVKWGGIAQRLEETHPLMQFSPENVQLLFNLGIHFDTRAGSEQGGDWLGTERFAYFRENTFYVMATPLLEQADPILINFIEREKKKQANATLQNPYFPFIDGGKPSEEMIKSYGLRIPEKMYLVLGDNFAMSADSRDFGFVPEGNLRGAPSFIFWPLGSRLGAPIQPGTSFTTLPNLIIWGMAVFAMFAWWIYQKRRYKLPLQFK